MKGNDALRLARIEMDKYELVQWKVILVSSKTVAGWCRTNKWNIDPRMSWGTIALSTPYIDVWDEEHVMEVIRHEIAHALTNPTLKDHGPEWKYMARKVGSTGDRCVSPEAPKPVSRYVGTCTGGHKFARHRMTWQLEHGQYWCPKCTTKSARAYITWTDTTTNRRVGAARKAQPVLSPPPAPAQTTATKVPNTKLKLPKVVDVPKVKTPTWKDKFDQGMTSFGDDW